MARKPSKKILLQLIDKTGGVVLTMAKKCKVTRKTMYNWINNDPVLKQAHLDARDVIVDLSEEGLLYNIKKKKERSILYALGTLGKGRGYVQRIETKDVSNLDRHLDEMSDEEIIQEMNKSRDRIKKG